MKKRYGLLGLAVLLATSVTASESDNLSVTSARVGLTAEESPGSITILQGARLRKLGITKIADALKLVPGFTVVNDRGSSAGSHHRTGYHGMQSQPARRMLLMIDGAPVLRPADSDVYSDELPLELAQIERVEVVRGPAAASYGANAFLAVINIITRNAYTAPEGEFAIRTGSGERNVYASRSSAGDVLGWYAGVSHQSDEGYGHLQDSIALTRGSLAAEVKAGSEQIAVRVQSVRGERDEAFFTANQTGPSELEINDRYAMLRWDHAHSDTHTSVITMNEYRQHRTREIGLALPRAALLPELMALSDVSPQLALALVLRQPLPPPSSLPPDVRAAFLRAVAAVMALGSSAGEIITGNTNENFDEAASELSWQETILFDQWRFTGALSLREARMTSEMYLHDSLTQESRQGFLQGEYLGDEWLFNVAAHIEEDERGDTWLLSPRIGVNWRVAEGWTMRAIVTEARRSPDAYERDLNWYFTVRDLSSPVNGGSTTANLFNTVHGNPDLEAEKVLSRELGVRHDGEWSLDVRVFDDDYRQLISERLQFFGLRLSNENEADSRGVEFDLSIPLFGGRLGVQYLYHDLEATAAEDEWLAARHVGGVQYEHSIGEFGVYGRAWSASSILGEGTTELAAGVNRAWEIGEYDLHTQLAVTYLAHAVDGFIDPDPTAVNADRYQDELRASVTASLVF